MNLQENILLKNYSNYKIGGPAKYFVQVTSVTELKEVLILAKNKKIDKIAILGGGTKALISDEGFDGLVICNNISGIRRAENNVEAGSGVLVKDLLNYCIDNSLSGLQWAGGLPGTVGGAIRGNAGSFNGETKDAVSKVVSLDLKTLDEKTRTNSECKFGYRDSIFKSGEAVGEFVTSAVFELETGNKERIREEVQEKINSRINRQPLDYPSLGSTFKNIPFSSLSEDLQKKFLSMVKNDPFPVIPVTKLLALCGLKGKKAGGAMISGKQTNFILNIKDAKAQDVKKLIEIAKITVKKKYNILLQEEIVYLN
jgi:UDP-N-acetylmuramate dehydrogenase